MNVARSVSLPDISGHYFIDTNILVYSFDQTDSHKQAVSQLLIARALTSRKGIISTQNVQEFLNVALKKFNPPLSLVEAQSVLDRVLFPLCRHTPSIPFYHQSMLIQAETGYSLYDSMVISAAIATNCEILFTEDLQNGHEVHGITIINPFVEKMR